MEPSENLQASPKPAAGQPLPGDNVLVQSGDAGKSKDRAAETAGGKDAKGNTVIQPPKEVVAPPKNETVPK
jgi:hypothetical protein